MVHHGFDLLITITKERQSTVIFPIYEMILAAYGIKKYSNLRLTDE